MHLFPNGVQIKRHISDNSSGDISICRRKVVATYMSFLTYNFRHIFRHFCRKSTCLNNPNIFTKLKYYKKI